MQKHQWINIKNIISTIALSSPLFSNNIHAQYGNPWMGQAINQNIMRGKEAASEYEMQSKKHAWQAREDAILRKIDQYRSTPYYGSFAVNPHDNTAIYWSGGGKISAELSQKQALELCGHADCKILKTFSNACAAITFPIDENEMFVSVDPSPQKAVSLSAQLCSKKYGVDGCKISIYKEKNSYAYCSGYDYGAYNQR